MDDEEDDFYASGNVRDMEDEEKTRPGIGHNSGEDEEEVLEGLDFDDMLRESRTLLLKSLYKAVKQGCATPQEQNTLRQMLKDNGMVMGDPFEGSQEGVPSNARKADLPEFKDPEYD